MNSTGIYGWVVALVLGATTVGIYVYGDAQIQAAREAASAREAVSDRQIQAILTTMDGVSAELEETKLALAKAEARLSEQDAAASAAAGSASAAVPENWTGLIIRPPNLGQDHRRFCRGRCGRGSQEILYSDTSWPPMRCSWMMRSRTSGVHWPYQTASG